MQTILIGYAAALSFIVQKDGAPVAIASGSAVTVRIYSADGTTPLTAAKTIAQAPGWASGQVDASFTQGELAAVTEAGLAVAVVTSTLPALAKRFQVSVEDPAKSVKSLLFTRDIIVDELRADALMIAAAGAFPGVKLSDDYIWQKVVAAEASIQRTLRVPLVSTKFFPIEPTQAQIDALNGMPWQIDTPYDYSNEQWQGDRWGFIFLRNKPLSSVESVRIVYPAQNVSLFDIPDDWIRIDQKYAYVRFVPTSTAAVTSVGAFLTTVLGGIRSIPQAFQVTYTAGLENAARDYPDLLDVIKKQAAVLIVQDSFLPSSGSISADGLSQSFGAKISDYSDVIDMILNGPKGSNGGLMTAIHGVRVGFLGM